MPPENIPIVPTVPVIGQPRQSAMDTRREALQKFAATKNPIFKRIYHKTIQRGSLVTFNYMNWKHDPYPLVLCSGIYSDGRVSGVNLHYLTFRYIKYLIDQYCGKAFSYTLIKNNKYIQNAFRTYRRDAIRNSKVMDCEFLMNLLGTVRSFRPNEIEAIRQEVQKQLRAKMNPTAEELESSTNEYTSTVMPDPRYKTVPGYDPANRFDSSKPTLDDARKTPNLSGE